MKPKFHRFIPAAITAWAVATSPAIAYADAPPDALADARKQIEELFHPSAADQPFESAALRYIPGKDRTVIQTPCYRLVDDRGRHIELTGAIHIGEKSYYEALNEHFKSFDAVLFECVADPDRILALQTGAKPDGPAQKEAPLSKMYRVFAHDLLSMSLQMERVNYRQPNFIHADLGETEFTALLASNGMKLDDLIAKTQKDQGLKLSLDQLGTLLPMLKIFIPKDDPAALKRMIAPMFIKMETPDQAEGLQHELLIGSRNQRALEVLDRELAAGKKNVSIFYGSAHLPDFKKSLNQRGWKDDGVEWRDAWIVSPKTPAATTGVEGPAIPAAVAERASGDNIAVAGATAAADDLLLKAFGPFENAKAVGFKSTLTIRADTLGQKTEQQATAEVTAMKPNFVTIHSQGMDGKKGTLVSDGTTVTLYTDGAATYRQLPAPASFGDFSKLPGLAELGLDESNNVFSYLSLHPGQTAAEAGFVGGRVLEPADLGGQLHDRVQLDVQGNKVVLWMLKDSPFPLVKLDIDTTKLLEQQLSALGEQAKAFKDMIKMEAAIRFSEGKVAESFPMETFRFTPPAGTAKE